MGSTPVGVMGIGEASPAWAVAMRGHRSHTPPGLPRISPVRKNFLRQPLGTPPPTPPQTAPFPYLEASQCLRGTLRTPALVHQRFKGWPAPHIVGYAGHMPGFRDQLAVDYSRAAAMGVRSHMRATVESEARHRSL